jgi:hypothetical protein
MRDRNPQKEVGQHMKVWLKRPGEGPTTGGFYPKSGRLFRGLLVGVLAVTLIGAPSVGFAGEKAASVSRESGLGAAAAISSLVYGPVKVFYALGGLVIGSFAWVFTAGDSEVAEMVFTRSLRGTYVITPEILVGDERLEFIGRDSYEEPAATETVAVAETPTAIPDDSGYDEMGW